MTKSEDLPTHVLPNTTEKDQQIGPYRLLQRIGDGGMGEVWLAQQESPRRQVALKLIRPGMDTEQVVARFDAERQALAVMDHTNIAKVFDAGETELGRPYFVMEYVKGETITDYCDRHRLSTRERLELFLEVCRGVQHAHQKAVIHRDLKPSNILVTVQDDRPVPKIIDFGIAKAINRELTERTLFTELGQIIGTPEYMAPEQAELFDADVDTRADVYSLGVLLYELLVGARPFNSRDLLKAGLAEIHRNIREVEPPKPSTRASTLGETISRVAELRRTDASSLIRVLRGDLDWITMKALEKDRTRRYASANDLLRDVERHLHDEPVTARPPEFSYRARKFVRRHRTAVLAASLILASLIFGIAAATWQAVEARRAERQAQEQARRADRHALTSDRVAQFLLSLFEAGDPYKREGELTVAQLLESGLAEIDQLQSEPLVQSDLLWTLGEAMLTSVDPDRGQALLDRALVLRENELNPNDPELLYSRFLRANRGDEGVNEAWRGHAQAAFESLEGLNDMTSRQRRAKLQFAMGEAAMFLDNDLDTAAQLHRQALEAFEQLELESGQRLTDTPAAIEFLGYNAILQGDLTTAETWYRKAVDYGEAAFGKTHARYAQSLGQYATILRDLDRLPEAERTAIDAYEIRLAAIGAETKNVAYDLGVVTSIYRAQEKFDQAEATAREMLGISRRVEPTLVPKALCQLSDVLVAQGGLDEAAKLLNEASELGGDEAFDCQRAQGMLLLKRGDSAAGDALLTTAFENLQQRDPVNFSVGSLAREAEEEHRKLGNATEANAWQRREDGS